MFDLFQSRANYNEPCRYWKRDERDKNKSDELVMRRTPSGSFMAQEVSAEQMEHLIVGGVFMFDRENTTIKTPDDLSGIRNEDLVEFRGEKWIIASVQRSKAKIQNTFFASDSNCSHYWYLELRK